MPASALDNAATSAGEVLFEGSHPTSNLRMSGQPEVPHTEDEKAEKTLLIFRRTKQILNCPNTSMLIADVKKKKYAQKTGNVEHDP